jgi:ribosomal protein S18 acetylase RimI-like enzyme
VNASLTLIERLSDLPPGCLDGLVADSEGHGLSLVRRLVEEWRSGANRFDRPGEALFVARCDGRVVGACGLNVDPYAGRDDVGRVRHLYVLTVDRRLGIGERLVTEVIAVARGRFDRLRLRTTNPVAARLYERLGFRRSETSDASHLMDLR